VQGKSCALIPRAVDQRDAGVEQQGDYYFSTPGPQGSGSPDTEARMWPLLAPWWLAGPCGGEGGGTGPVFRPPSRGESSGAPDPAPAPPPAPLPRAAAPACPPRTLPNNSKRATQERCTTFHMSCLAKGYVYNPCLPSRPSTTQDATGVQTSSRQCVYTLSGNRCSSHEEEHVERVRSGVLLT
jgi:hypothetical protein